jgi:hypothetical protein
MEARPFEVDGYGGAPLPLVLYESGGESVAVVFPGACRAGYRLGGSPARPDLNYARALLVEEGFDVLEVWWDADSKPDATPEWYRANALAAVRAAGEARVHVLVGRSMGTVALSFLPELGHLKSIWIAPLTKVDLVKEALIAWPGAKMVIAGDADDAFESVSEVETLVIPDADHALDVGSASASARALAGVLDKMREFLAT